MQWRSARSVGSFGILVAQETLALVCLPKQIRQNDQNKSRKRQLKQEPEA
jgi:hypothetical protein